MDTVPGSHFADWYVSIVLVWKSSYDNAAGGPNKSNLREYLKRRHSRNTSLYSPKAPPAATVCEIRPGLQLRRDIQLAESCFCLGTRTRIIGWKERLRDNIWLAETIGKISALDSNYSNDDSEQIQQQVSPNLIVADTHKYWEFMSSELIKERNVLKKHDAFGFIRGSSTSLYNASPNDLCFDFTLLAKLFATHVPNMWRCHTSIWSEGLYFGSGHSSERERQVRFVMQFLLKLYSEVSLILFL